MQKKFLLGLSLCMAALYGCDENNSGTFQEEDSTACNPVCQGTESCVDGKCLCGGNECGDDETCVEGQCEKPFVPPDEDPCKDKTCGEGEHCDAGKCLCGDEECGADESCVEGVCNSVPKDSDGPISDCDPVCGDNEVCEDGACKPIVSEPDCKKISCGAEQYCENGICKDVPMPCSPCKDGEACIAGVCMCGKYTCKEDEYCRKNACEPIDPCSRMECMTGEICVDGKCKVINVTLSPASLDVMLSSVSNKLVATSLDGSKLVWTVDGKAADQDMPVLKCRKSDKTLSTKLSECIIKKDNTETVQFVGYTRHLKTVKIAVKNSAGETAEATLTLKPYFDTGGFIKTNDLIYRNGYCPGQQMMTNPKKGFIKYDPKLDNTKANLGGIKTKYGPKNDYGVKTFSEEELAVIDKDMYIKYIHAKMLKKDGSFYGTRASVVAAARFLILQFPYDIPYTSNGVNNHKKVLSHYLFTKGELDDVLKVDIHGLNLTSNAYNSTTNHDESNIIRDDVVPWGGAYNEPFKSKYKGEDLEFPYNGLECTGFVTWALRNGFLGLGDWNTNLFAKDGRCRKGGKAYPDGKASGVVERNYKCEDIVNNKDGNYSDTTNKNNRLLQAYPKLTRLKDEDFKDISKKDEKTLQAIFKDAKAGDLLVRNNNPTDADLTKYPDMIYKYGHVAMIIGIKRDSKGITAIEVGEAMSKSGNRLTLFKSMEEFAKSSDWVNSNAYKAFLVKMDNVYNYYSDKYDIKTESKTSDCPNNVKSGGNCYNYTDTYNDAFNDALKMQ